MANKVLVYLITTVCSVIFVSFLAGLGQNSCCTAQTAHKLDQQSRQQKLRAYCSKTNTVPISKKSMFALLQQPHLKKFSPINLYFSEVGGILIPYLRRALGENPVPYLPFWC